MKRTFLSVLALLTLCLLLSGCASRKKGNTDSSGTTASGSSSELNLDGTSSDEGHAEPESTADSQTESAAGTVSAPAASKAPTDPAASGKPSQTGSAAPAVSTAPAPAPSTPPTPAASTPPVPASSAPAVQEVSVTIPEGYTFMQIARLLEQKGVCTQQDFFDVCQSYTPKSFTIPTSADRCFRMEGYLYPDTYRFYTNDNPTNVLIKMLNNYYAHNGALSDSTLILASIIEKEARSNEQMQLVSSVFHNRLNSSAFLYLDADPTRDYVNNYITGNALLSDTGRFAALYNTCGKRQGLPAGPICCPSARAIQAALHPTDTTYYYFFYGADGNNHYSETLEEHDALQKQFGVG